MNWGKMLKFAGISTGICLALVAGVIVAYSQMFVAPETVVREPLVLMQHSVVGEFDSDIDEWEADFSEALAFVPEFVEEEWDEWQRKENFYTMMVLVLDDQNNSDVLWIVSFDTENHVMNILDVPRDTKVPHTPRDVKRINAAYSNGRIRDGHDEGVRQAKWEIAWLIGFQPDFYMIVPMQMFARAVDEIFGGVTVHVPMRMEYYSPLQNLHINLSAGTQRLTGQQAVHFARFRQSSDRQTLQIGTVRRGEHIFMLFEALAREAWGRMPGFLTQIPAILDMYERYARTNLGLDNLAYFAEAFLLNDVEFHYQRIPADYITRPRWYDVPILEYTIELVNTYINPFTRDIEVIMPDEMPSLEEFFWDGEEDDEEDEEGEEE